jgi:hypothetical protein
MQLGGRVRMVFSMQVMAVRGMGMVRRRLGVLIPMMLGGFAVMVGGLFVMSRGSLVMFGDLRRVRHGLSPDGLMDEMSGCRSTGRR